MFTKGLCSLVLSKEGGFLFEISEPIVIKCIISVVGERDAQYKFGVELLTDVLNKLGFETSTKGNAFELLVFWALKRLGPMELKELPFLKKKKLPEWTKGKIWKVEKSGDALSFDLDFKNDLDFVMARRPNLLLQPGISKTLCMFNNKLLGQTDLFTSIKPIIFPWRSSSTPTI